MLPRKLVLIYGSLKKDVRVEARFSESCESGDPLLRKVGGNLLIYMNVVLIYGSLRKVGGNLLI